MPPTRFLALLAFTLTCVPFVSAPAYAGEQENGNLTNINLTMDWPWWRGPHRNGVASSQQDLPTTWSSQENIIWKTPIIGRGHGSPTVVGNAIYLATADEKAEIQSVLCLDRATGKEKWKTDVHQGGFETKGNKRSSHASCTIACDGERLFVNFNHKKTIYTTALDLMGKVLWQTKITPYVTHQGYGSSPAVYGSLVLVTADNKGGGAIAALKRENGEIVWKYDRPKTPNYPSPIVLTIDGKDLMFLSGCNMVSCYEPKTGKKIWEVEGATTECVTSTVTNGKLIITSGGYPRNHIAAHDAKTGKLIWNHKTRCYVPSMVVHDNYLYAVNDSGIVLCIDMNTGEETWKERLGGTFNSSLVLVGDQIYATDERGKTYIYKANPKQFELIAQSKLGDDVYPTPTICGNRIYMRVAHFEDGERQEYLYCIGKKN